MKRTGIAIMLAFALLLCGCVSARNDAQTQTADFFKNSDGVKTIVVCGLEAVDKDNYSGDPRGEDIVYPFEKTMMKQTELISVEDPTEIKEVMGMFDKSPVYSDCGVDNLPVCSIRFGDSLTVYYCGRIEEENAFIGVIDGAYCELPAAFGEWLVSKLPEGVI